MHALKTVPLAGLLVTSAACATTFFNSTWVNPYTTPVALTGQKIVALMITGEETTRRAAEDTLARQITARGGQGVAAWTIISTADVRNEENTRAAMTSAGAVAAQPGLWRRALSDDPKRCGHLFRRRLRHSGEQVPGHHPHGGMVHGRHRRHHHADGGHPERAVEQLDLRRQSHRVLKTTWRLHRGALTTDAGGQPDAGVVVVDRAARDAGEPLPPASWAEIWQAWRPGRRGYREVIAMLFRATGEMA